MKSWQKKLRLAIAVFGIVFAAVVYSAIGEREASVSAPPPVRVDPKAVIETRGAIVRQIRGTKQDYEIRAEDQLVYEGGSMKFRKLTVTVRERAGQDFVVSADEALAGEKQQDLELTGNVRLTSSDGFQALTERATFSESDGVVRAPGAVTFSKGRMSGSGVGMTYDKTKDVLTILDASRVRVTDEGDNTVLDMASGSSMLSRPENVLVLDRAVHVLRGEQVIDADAVTAKLTPDQQHVTFLELRGNARVSGGGNGVDSMSARDIDLDYTEDGAALERVLLTGGGAIAMTGQQGAPGRQLAGERLDLTLAPDGSLTRALGQQNVRLDLPAAPNAAGRSVRSQQFDGSGAAGQGLTSARFTNDVEYREEPPGASPRVARSSALTVALVNDVISSAVFTGRVTFEEQGLAASAAEARYQPDKGTLRLTGADAGGGPRVADDRVNIEARAIDITLQGRKMTASGDVKTRLVGGPANARAGTTETRLPGLLREDQPTNVNADALQYDGAAGTATYTGNATLWQGDTAIRADRIALDQSKGDLVAIGSARSTLVMDGTTSIGRAGVIRYEDATREVTYSSGAAPLTSKPAVPAAAASAGTRTSVPTVSPAPSSAPGGRAVQPAEDAPAPGPGHPQLSGPQGDLRAGRIVIHLAKADGKMDRLEAYTNVTLKLDTRAASGARLTYFAADQRYVMSGAGVVPVKVVEACRETTGKTLTFFRAADRIIVDGNEEIRTQTKSGGPCPEPRSP